MNLTKYDKEKENQLINPIVLGRKKIERSELKLGDVVAFVTEYDHRLRTGLMVLTIKENDFFYWAVNLYKEDGREWIYDCIPSDDIMFFEATDEEKKYALMKCMHEVLEWFCDSESISDVLEYKDSMVHYMKKYKEITLRLNNKKTIN